MADFEQRIEDFFTQFTPKRYQKGDTIIWGGCEPEGVYYISEGHVRQYSISEHTGNTLTLHIYHPRSFFPMIWALAEKPNSHFFEAMGTVIAYRAPKDAVLYFLSNDVEVLYHFSARLLSGLNGLLFRMETFAFTDTYGRLIAELFYLAKHFGKLEGTGILLPPFTHQELADFVGSARETTSIAIENLVKKKLIMYQGHAIYIPQIEALSQELRKKRRR